MERDKLFRIGTSEPTVLPIHQCVNNELWRSEAPWCVISVGWATFARRLIGQRTCVLPLADPVSEIRDQANRLRTWQSTISSAHRSRIASAAAAGEANVVEGDDSCGYEEKH